VSTRAIFPLYPCRVGAYGTVAVDTRCYLFITVSDDEISYVVNTSRTDKCYVDLYRRICQWILSVEEWSAAEKNVFLLTVAAYTVDSLAVVFENWHCLIW